MELNDETWHLVKSTPKVTGFVGGATQPAADLRDGGARDHRQMAEGAVRPKPKVLFESGEHVKVIDGPFQDFNGVVEEVQPDKGKLQVLISIFGRSTPVELDFVQVEKACRRTMAKKVIAEIKLQIPAGQANPSPPVGPALGQRGVNIMEFCKPFNAQTQAQQGLIIPVIITVYADRSFTFITKTPPASVLLKKAAGVEKGSRPSRARRVGKVTKAQVEEIAKLKLPDLDGQGSRSGDADRRGHGAQHRASLVEGK